VLFSLAWAFAGMMDAADRRRVGTRMAELSANVPPGTARGEILEYLLVDGPQKSSRDRQVWAHGDTLCSHWRYQEAADAARAEGGKIIVPTARACALEALFLLLAHTQTPLLIVGEEGSGRSVLAGGCLAAAERKAPDRNSWRTISLFPSSSGQFLQGMIQRTVRRRHGRSYAPPGGKRLSLLIDDVNAPSPDQFGDQPAAEVMRDLLGQRGFYSRSIPGERTVIEDMHILATAVCTRQMGREMPARFRRHWFVANLSPISQKALAGIFAPLVEGRSRAFHSASGDALDALAAAVPAAVEAVTAAGRDLHTLARVPPSPPPRTKWTRRVPHPVLIGHAASLTP